MSRNAELRQLLESGDFYTSANPLADAEMCLQKEDPTAICMVCGGVFVKGRCDQCGSSPEEFYLWCDNGTKHFYCASRHTTLDAAVEVADSGYQARQYITIDPGGDNVVWKRY